MNRAGERVLDYASRSDDAKLGGEPGGMKYRLFQPTEAGVEVTFVRDELGMKQELRSANTGNTKVVTGY